MVTKQSLSPAPTTVCLILAKNHMVTKLDAVDVDETNCLILAKNHMVTKRMETFYT